MYPSHIGRYEIIGLLGSGGMAEVFLGRLVGPSGFQRPVVIKRILPNLARKREFVHMFLDEARIAADIRHQNVVQVYELGQDGGSVFIVMEYLEGESILGLARRLAAREQLLSFPMSAYAIAEACSGLHAAHELTDAEGKKQNLVHRDISPANVFATYDGEVKILDFGIALAANRLTQTDPGRIKGKLAYLSPEQCRGHELDRRSDIFSLGIVLYELSTCHRLFDRGSEMLTMEAICSEELIPPSHLIQSYPSELERICMKALARDPRQRYQTALEMRTDLLELAHELSQGVDSVGALSKVMRRLFESRMLQKRALLSRIRSGRPAKSVPLGDTDKSIQLPTVLTDTDSGAESQTILNPDASSTQRPPPSPSKAWVIGAAAAGLLVSGALAAPPLLRGRAPEAIASVSVRVEVFSKPEGAQVYVADSLMGQTPLAIALPRNDRERVTVTLRREGYEPLKESFVPDVPQRLHLTLDPVRR
jgi:serine/threonine-protein kinase